MSKQYVGNSEFDIKLNKGLTGTYVDSKGPLVFNDLATNDLLYHKNLPHYEKVSCMIMIPISYAGLSIGAINVFKEGDCSLSKTNKFIVRSYGTFAGSILKNVLLIEELYKLKEDYQSMIVDSLNSSKTSFIKPISSLINHEIKNILNIFKMQIDEIISDNKIMGKLSKNKQKELVKVKKKLDVSMDVTKNLSELFTLTQNEDQQTDINLYEIFKRAVIFLSTKLVDPLIEVDISNIDKTISIRGIYMEFLIIIFNLLNNAIKAVRRTSRNSSPKGNIYISAKRQAGQILISVEDDGCGVKNEDKDKIFDPGFTTDRSSDSKSSGIGLFGSQRIIKEEYDGTISFTTRFGKGTTFYISLPILKEGR